MTSLWRHFCLAVAEWYGAGLAIARSRVRIPPLAAVYQRQLSVSSIRGRSMSTSESWGINGHTTRCTGPVSVVLRLRLVSGWGLRKRRSAPPHGPRGSGKDFTFYFYLAIVEASSQHAISHKPRISSDLPSLPHLAGDSRILEPSPAHPPRH